MRGLRRLWAGMLGAMALIAPEATAQVSTDKPNFVILLIDEGSGVCDQPPKQVRAEPPHCQGRGTA